MTNQDLYNEIKELRKEMKEGHENQANELKEIHKDLFNFKLETNKEMSYFKGKASVFMLVFGVVISMVIDFTKKKLGL